jgi:Flp pilus assembly protein TadD
LLGEMGRTREAEERLREAVRLGPENGEARWELGRLLLRLGKKAEARPHVEKAAAAGEERIRELARRALATW